MAGFLRIGAPVAAAIGIGVAGVGFAASPPPAEGENGMVVTAQRLATEVGLDVLKAGGNAVDAAVAVGYALAVTYPDRRQSRRRRLHDDPARGRGDDVPRLSRARPSRRDPGHVSRRGGRAGAGREHRRMARGWRAGLGRGARGGARGLRHAPARGADRARDPARPRRVRARGGRRGVAGRGSGNPRARIPRRPRSSSRTARLRRSERFSCRPISRTP